MKALVYIWILFVWLCSTFHTVNSKVTLLTNAKNYVKAGNHESASQYIHEYITSYGADADIITVQKLWLPAVIRAYLEPSIINERTVKWKQKPSKNNCSPGILDTFEYLSFESNLNLVRLLAGVPKINDIDVELSKTCQEAAWTMHVNDDIKHDIPKTWKCYSVAAALAAGSSNLAYGYSAGQALMGMLKDEETSNTAVGHRRWLLNPALTFPGYGLTENTAAIWVTGQKANFREVYQDMSYFDKRPICWPSAGIHPIVFNTKRFSISLRKADFKMANITALKNNNPIKVTKQYVQENYGQPTLVFDVHELPQVGDTYQITVSNFKDVNGKIMQYRYQTTIVQ